MPKNQKLPAGDGKNAVTIRPYLHEQDFESLRQWSTDARTHAMWCADLLPYPPDAEGFADALRQIQARSGDQPYIAADAAGEAVGFFCAMPDPQTKEIMLKFVIVDPARRGQGVGQRMLRAAVRMLFAQTDADAVQLMVFAENPAARACYRHAGFSERSLTPDAFRFGDETWSRCNMVIRRADMER